MADRAAAQTAPDDDWGVGNLIANGDFSGGIQGSLPKGWEAVCPNPVLAPAFTLVGDDNRSRALMAKGNGQPACFGYVRHPVRFEANRTYRLRVLLRCEGLADLNRHLLHGVFGDFNDGVFSYRKEGDWVIGEGRFPAPQTPANGEVRLCFRYSPHGRVWWKRVSLQECAPAKPRPVTVAVSWGGGSMEHWAHWLDAAGKRSVDIALLPEGFNSFDIQKAEPPDGSAATLMACKAREWKMYVSGSYYQQRGDLRFNTAPLFDREGRLAGQYDKVQLYDPEMYQGVTPGEEMHVFDADFGRVGIMICYDSWFPETARLLAYRGAELILFPSAGYYEELMPARAADNGVWIAASSHNNAAGVWDSGGARAGEKEADPSRFVQSSIQSVNRDEQLRMLVVTLDMSRRWSPHYWGGPMLSAPGGRRVRQTAIESIEEKIAREAARWWEPETSCL